MRYSPTSPPCAHPVQTATTFSAAGDVRRRLAAHGFSVRRVDQRPYKRHSTAAVFAGTGRTFRAPREAVVVGAGLAGTATARRLADKGIAVTLLDRGEGVASGASAIPAAVLHPRLLAAASVEGLYRLHAFLYAATWLPGRSGVATTGVFQRAGKSGHPARLRRVAAVIPDEIAAYKDPARSVRPCRGAGQCAGAVLSRRFDHQRQGTRAGPRERSEHRGPAGPGPATGHAGHSGHRRGCGRIPAPRGRRSRRTARPLRLRSTARGADRRGRRHRPDTASVWTGATYEYSPWDPERAARRTPRATPVSSVPNPAAH